MGKPYYHADSAIVSSIGSLQAFSAVCKIDGFVANLFTDCLLSFFKHTLNWFNVPIT